VTKTLARNNRFVTPEAEHQMHMRNRTLRIAALALVAIAFVLAPQSLRAQTTNTSSQKNSAAEKKDAHEKKASSHPFHGILKAVDKNAKTITVGKVTYQITSETKFKKHDKPATLDDGVVGEEAAGYLKPDANGKLFASSVRFGPKPETKGASSKKADEKKK
jgi:hypothetical protein